MRILKKSIAGAILAAAITTLSSPANADFIKQYGRVGAWTIFGSDTNRDSCAADRDNQQVTLRIVHTEYTGDWMIGNPYYNDIGDINGGFGFSRVPQETLKFSTYFFRGWAMHSLAPNMVNELRLNNKLVIELDRGPQVFSLNGSSAAMAMLQECVRNKGVKPAQNFVQQQPQKRQNFQQPQRRQNNQRPAPQNSENFYANVRGWTVNSATNSSGIFYCVAGKISGNQIMRIGFSGSQWAIGMPTARQSGNTLGELYIEMNRGQVIHGGQATYTHYQDGWATTPLSFANVDHLKRGTSVAISIDNNGFAKFSLSGSTAAMLKVQECVQYRGIKPRRQVQQPAPRRQNVQPRRQQTYVQPRRQQHVQQRRNNNYYVAKSRVSGSWIWGDPGRNAKHRGEIASIHVLGNNQATYCISSSCYNVRYQLHPNNSISFTTNGKNRFEFWETSPNQVSGQFWANYSAGYGPDATVRMR